MSEKNGKGLKQALSESEGLLIFAGFVTAGLIFLTSTGALTGEQLLLGLFGEGALFSILKKKKD